MNRSKRYALSLTLALVLASLCILPGARQSGASGGPAATSHDVYLPLLLKERRFLTPAPTVTATLTPTPTVADCADVYEPDGEWLLAKSIDADVAAQFHNSHRPGDLDFVKFAAAAGETLILRAFDLGGGLQNDTTLTLYDVDGGRSWPTTTTIHRSGVAGRASSGSPMPGAPTSSR